MTRQELTERLRRSRGMSDYENQTGDREAVAALDALYAEIDALRKLPVIRTCGECRWYSIVGHDDLCKHNGTSSRIDSREAPPEWCPLRGGAK